MGGAPPLEPMEDLKPSKITSFGPPEVPLFYKIKNRFFYEEIEVIIKFDENCGQHPFLPAAHPFLRVGGPVLSNIF